MKDQLLHIIMPIRKKRKLKQGDPDVETADPFERMEKAIKRESQKKATKPDGTPK
jgi:hypothetical protein